MLHNSVELQSAPGLFFVLLERLYVGLVLKEFCLTSNSLIDNLSALEIPGERGGKRIQGWCVVSFPACTSAFRMFFAPPFYTC